MQYTDENGNKMIIRADLKGLSIQEYIIGRIREFVDKCLVYDGTKIIFSIYNFVLNIIADRGNNIEVSVFIQYQTAIRGNVCFRLMEDNIETLVDNMMNDIDFEKTIENTIDAADATSADGEIIFKENIINRSFTSTRVGFGLTKLFKKYLYDIVMAYLSVDRRESLSVIIRLTFVDVEYVYELDDSDKIFASFTSYYHHKRYDSSEIVRSIKAAIGANIYNDNAIEKIIDSYDFESFVIELCNCDELRFVRKNSVKPAIKDCEQFNVKNEL